MAFNLNTTDLKVYFDANVAVNICLFMFLVLPPFLLCLVCIVALVFATEINVKIRLLLINIYAAEISEWLAYAVVYLGWPARQLYDKVGTCHFFISSFAFLGVQKFTAGAIYAIKVFIFIKYGEKNLKWYVIIPFLTIAWTVAILYAILPYVGVFGIEHNNGFCTANSSTPIFKGTAASLVLVSLTFVSIQVICSVSVIVYTKNNVLEGNIAVKRAVAKVAGYLIVASILSFFNTITPIANPLIKNAIPENNIVGAALVNYLLRLIFNVPAVATPIVGIILLKPLCIAIKNISKKACTCSSRNKIRPTKEN